MIRSKNLRSIIARWQTWWFFFLQERLNITFFLKPQKNNQACQTTFIDGYRKVHYYIMNADIRRMSAYADIAKNHTLCKGKTFVDIGTGMYLTLTKLVLEGGAAYVDAIEANKESYEGATEEWKSMNQSIKDKIELHKGLSTEINLNKRVDAIIHEIVGTIASNEGMPFVIANAQERFLIPDGLVIPEIVETLMVPIEEPPIGLADRFVSWLINGGTYKLESKPSVQLIYNPSKHVRLSDSSEVVESFVCGPNAPSMCEQLIQDKHISFLINRTGNFCGFLLGCHIVTHRDSPAINALEQITNWGIIFTRILETPRIIYKGTKLDVHFHVDASTITPSYLVRVSFDDGNFAEVKWKGPCLIE